MIPGCIKLPASSEIFRRSWGGTLGGWLANLSALGLGGLVWGAFLGQHFGGRPLPLVSYGRWWLAIARAMCLMALRSVPSGVQVAVRFLTGGRGISSLRSDGSRTEVSELVNP